MQIKNMQAESDSIDYYSVFSPSNVSFNSQRNKKLISQVDIQTQYYNNTDCTFVIRGRDNLAITLACDDKDGSCYFDREWQEYLYIVKTFSFNQKISKNLIDAIQAGAKNDHELELLLKWIDQYTQVHTDFTKPTKFCITYKIKPSDFDGEEGCAYVKQIDQVVACFKNIRESNKDIIHRTPLHPHSEHVINKPDKPHIGFTRSIELIDNGRHLQNIYIVSGNEVIKIPSVPDAKRQNGIYVTTRIKDKTYVERIDICDSNTAEDKAIIIKQKEEKYGIYHYERDAQVRGDYKSSIEKVTAETKLKSVVAQSETIDLQSQEKIREIEKQKELEVLKAQNIAADRASRDRDAVIEQQRREEERKAEEHKREEDRKAEERRYQHELEVIRQKELSMKKKERSETFKYIVAITTGVVALAAGIWKWFSSRG